LDGLGVLTHDLPLSFVEWEETRAYSKMKSTTAVTLKRRMYSVMQLVVAKIKKLAAEAPGYAVIYDGWSDGSTHYVGTWPSFAVDECDTHQTDTFCFFARPFHFTPGTRR
jgi:hypothetical protein